jgi:hypothetical protein
MQQAITRLAVLALAGYFLAGCSTGALREAFLGRKNELGSLDNATLGRTPRDEILQRYGAPDEIDQRGFDGHEVEVFFYGDEDVDEDSGQPRAKVLACEFARGVLTGYVFQVLGPDGGAGFDDSARGKLLTGTTTRGQVESLLGRPQGRALVPTTLTLHALGGQIGGVPAPLAGVPAGVKEVWLYQTQSLDPALGRPRQRSLIVYFDEKGVYLGTTSLRQLVSKSP